MAYPYVKEWKPANFTARIVEGGHCPDPDCAACAKISQMVFLAIQHELIAQRGQDRWLFCGMAGRGQEEHFDVERLPADSRIVLPKLSIISGITWPEDRADFREIMKLHLNLLHAGEHMGKVMAVVQEIDDEALMDAWENAHAGVESMFDLLAHVHNPNMN